MMQDPHRSVVPGPAFDAVVEWLDASYPPSGTRLRVAGAGAAPPVRGRSVAPDVREELVRFGSGERLFGVLTEPLGGAPSDRPAVVVLNAGALHRVGPNRTYVRLARRLAATGFTALRMDLGGIGDSLPAPGAPDNRVYSRDAVADVDAAMSFLAARTGSVRFVLAGLCSGAYVAFHAALADRRIAGAVMINPQTLTWKDGDTLEVSPSRSYSAVRYYRSAVVLPEKWARVLRGEVDLPHVARTFGRHTVLVAGTRLRRMWAAAAGTVVADDVPGAFAHLERRAVQVLLLMSGGDAGLDYLARCLGPAARRATATYRLQIIDGPDHTFTPLWSQDELCSRVLSFVDDLARSR
jgi:dienelactone hydrolase